MKARSAAVKALMTLAVSVAVLTGPLAPKASATDRYAFANGCFALRTIVSHKFVVKNADGSYRATAADKTGATPFRMQATALGRYLLYGPDGSMPAAGLLNKISATKTPGPAADWVVDTVGRAFVLKAFQTGQGVRSGTGGVLGLVASDPEGMAFESTTGCSNFPEVQVNVTGTPLKGATPTSPVRGFIDDHIHLGAFDFLGGRFHCGRPWSPYGVTVALTDCPDHFPNGAGAVFENFLASGSPVGTHSTDGWPSFAGWPRDESQTHEGTYWKWIERAWRSGLRLMVNDLVENRALCDLYPLKKNNCNEMTSAYKQADDIQALQDYIDAQFGGPGKGFFRIVKSSAEARQVINSGKLAVVLGVEESEVLNCGQTNGTPKCTAAQIDSELNGLYTRGIRSLFPVHKFDNALGGTKFDGGTSGVVVNAGNKYATGQFWAANHCDAADHDNEPTNPAGQNALLATLFGPVAANQLLSGQLPVYPPGPLCNPKGLTTLGDHLIRSMMKKGMIVETDHMSVKTRQQTLSILEAAHYPGVISSHSWGDLGTQKRLQKLGGPVGPISSVANQFADEWRVARANRDTRFTFGTPFGSDINGLHAQPVPRAGAAQNPVVYPFRSFDGGSVIDRQHSGTKVYDINTDGVDHYGLYPDWIEDLRKVAGPQIVSDMANGAEAYLQMWARAEAAAQ